MDNLHDTGNGVMMPPKSLHAPREWDRMLIEAQKKRIDDLQKRQIELEAALASAILDITSWNAASADRESIKILNKIKKVLKND